MATRILILDGNGKALYALDGHHGAAHAAAWAQQVQLAANVRGKRLIIAELQPAEGGDAMRRGIVGQLHRLRADWHTRPDGKRELVGLVLDGESAPGRVKHTAESMPVRGHVRLLAAPEDVHGERCGLRIPRGRMNPNPGQARTAAEARQLRRQARANARATR
jgi:hypothetical protein